MDLVNRKEDIENKLHSLGYELVSITSKREMGNNVINIVVDRIQPIDMTAIVKLSEELNAYIDTIDDSSVPYTLDISSLGAEKPLKIESIKDYVGSFVNVHLINPIDGENIYEGTIKEMSGDSSFVLQIKIKTRVKEVNILFNNIYKIRLAVKF